MIILGPHLPYMAPDLAWCLGMEIPEEVRKARNPSPNLSQKEVLREASAKIVAGPNGRN